MKNVIKLSVLAFIAIVVSLVGCESPGRLASKVEGDWSGTPIRFNRKMPVSGEMTPLFHFERSGSRSGGTMTVSADVAVMMPVNAPIDSAGVAAVSATASGIATVTGVWEADDDNDIDLVFDLSTLTITLNPLVEFELADMWSANDVPVAHRVSDAVQKTFAKQMKRAVTQTLRDMDKLKDIKFVNSDSLMVCKFAGSKQMLHRID